MAMSLMLVFIAMGIAVLIIKSNLVFPLIKLIDTMHDDLNRNCDLKAGTLYQIDQIYSKSEKILCSSNCPCDADATLWPED